MVNIPVVLVPRIMYGVEVRVFVIVPLSIHVKELDIVQEVAHLAEENTRVVIVPLIIVGMAALAFIITHILAQADIVHQIQV